MDYLSPPKENQRDIVDIGMEDEVKEEQEKEEEGKEESRKRDGREEIEEGERKRKK